MIITSTVGATGRVSELLIAQGAMEATLKMITNAIIAEGEQVGAFIKPDSIWFEEKTLPHTMQVEVTGEWCPNPAKGCIFVGGPFDGDERPIPAAKYGKPPEQWRMTVLQESTFATEDSGGPQSAEPTFVYLRAGKDSAADKWVYEIKA